MAGSAKFDKWYNTAGTPYGAVLQVVQSFNDQPQAWTSGYTGLGAASENRGQIWWTPDGMHVGIKPQSINSKILIFGVANLGVSTTDSYNVHWRVTNNGDTPVGSGYMAQTDGQSGTWFAQGQIRWHAANDYASNHTARFMSYHSPGSTNLQKYSFQVCHTYSSNYTTYFNRENDVGWESPASSHIIAMEIQQ